jgi:hypothetical protein
MPVTNARLFSQQAPPGASAVNQEAKVRDPNQPAYLFWRHIFRAVEVKERGVGVEHSHW